MIIDMGQNNSRYGVVVFYIPMKVRKKKKMKIFGGKIVAGRTDGWKSKAPQEILADLKM